jgi:hypothetical protein
MYGLFSSQLPFMEWIYAVTSATCLPDSEPFQGFIPFSGTPFQMV